MALLKTRVQNHQRDIVGDIQNKLTGNSAVVTLQSNNEDTKNLFGGGFSLQSNITDANVQGINTVNSDMTAIVATLQSIGLDAASLEEQTLGSQIDTGTLAQLKTQALEKGALVMMMMQDAGSQLKKRLLESETYSLQSGATPRNAASLSNTWANQGVTLQGFSEINVGAWSEMHIALNMHAALVSPATEIAFRTVQLNGNLEGLDVHLSRDVIQRNTVSPQTGEVFHQGRINALEATRKMGLITTDTNKLRTNVTSANAAKFVAAGKFTPVASTDLFGGTYNQSYIKFDQGRYNLLTLVRANGEIAGKDRTWRDAVARGLRVGKVLFTLGAEEFAIETGNYQGSIFASSKTEGDDSETLINFNASNFIIPINSLQVDGTVSTELAKFKSLADSISVTFNIAGSHVHSGGDTLVTAPVFEIDGVYSSKQAGVNLIKESAVQALVTALAVKALGWWPKGAILDDRLTIAGPIAEVQDRHWPMIVAPGSPIMAERPTNADTKSISRITALLGNLSRLTSDEKAAKYLLNYIDRLDSITNESGIVPIGTDIEFLDVASSGSFYTTPWCLHEEIEITDLVNTKSSGDAYGDACAAVSNLLRDRAGRMMTGSLYIPAIRNNANNNSLKAKMGIITSKTLAPYIRVIGEDSMFSSPDIEDKPEIATCDYDEFEDTIVMFPTTTSTGQYQQFNFGVRLDGVRLITEVEREDPRLGLRKVFQVTPMEEFYVTSPQAYRLKLKGLAKFVATAAAVKVDIGSNVVNGNPATGTTQTAPAATTPSAKLPSGN